MRCSNCQREVDATGWCGDCRIITEPPAATADTAPADATPDVALPPVPAHPGEQLKRWARKVLGLSDPETSAT